jgi:hypothetical protein
MFKRKLTIPDFFLILVNLIPLLGVWFNEWNARQVFLVYCMETVIIGLINVLKMMFVTIFIKKEDVWENGGSTSMQSGWLFIFFFIFHYGFFVFIQTQLFFAVSSTIPGSSLLTKYAKIPELLGPNGLILLLIFIAYYTMENLFGFFSTGTYKTISMGRLLFEPYMRIFVQQVVVIVGGIFLSFGAGKIFVVIFILTKIFFEVIINFDRILVIAEKKERLKRQLEENNKT